MNFYETFNDATRLDFAQLIELSEFIDDDAVTCMMGVDVHTGVP
jgi:hypothetical protein